MSGLFRISADTTLLASFLVAPLSAGSFSLASCMPTRVINHDHHVLTTVSSRTNEIETLGSRGKRAPERTSRSLTLFSSRSTWAL
jgi:hypothetical protein